MQDSVSIRNDLLALAHRPFGIHAYMLCFFICIVCYSSMIVLPAFNADDIIQGQPISKDTLTFLSQGRWGYFFIYQLLFQSNPLGPFGFILGIAILLSASVISANLLGFKSGLTVSVFSLVASISLFYTAIFSFDSTRVAYPISVLLMVKGLSLAKSPHVMSWLTSALLIGLSPAFFSASPQIGLTLIFLYILFSTLREERSITRTVLKMLFTLTSGLALYATSLKISPIATGIDISDRASINILEALASYNRFIKIIGDYGFMTSGTLGGNDVVAFITIVIFICAILSVAIWYRPVFIFSWVIIYFSIFAILIAPFWLAFLSPLDEFGPRALVAYSITHAGLFLITLQLIPIRHVFLRVLSISLAGIFVIGTALATSRISTDEYLASQNDLMATSRLISRIDEVLAGTDFTQSGPIPLAVRYNTALNMAPRGRHTTARQIPWSRGWIFRKVDPRFLPIYGEQYEQIIDRSTDRPIWPHPGSIYVDDGVVVVVIN